MARTTAAERSRASHAFRTNGLAGLIATAEVVLDAVCEAMAVVLETPRNRLGSFETTRRISRILFERLDVQRMRSTGLNEHLVRGLYAYGQETLSKRFLKSPSQFPRPRLTDLILMHCREAADQSDDAKQRGYVLIPSPIFVATEAMTVPEDVHTRAYAILAFRLLLSRRFNVWPSVSFSDAELPRQSTKLTEAEVVDEIRSIRTFLEHRDNRSAMASPVKQFVSHFVAGKGVLYLRLKAGAAARFLRAREFSIPVGQTRPRVAPPEFRLSKRYRELPEAATFINEMLGVPVALRGTDIILFNGLKPSADHSLLIEVSGGAGTGKTSLSLALAAALAPIDTYTLYLTFEEDEQDLRAKLAVQSQPRLRKLSFNSKKDSRWFSAVRVPGLDLQRFEKRVLEELASKLKEVSEARRKSLSKAQFVPPIPLMVVIDSISAIPIHNEVESRPMARPITYAQESTVGGVADHAITQDTGGKAALVASLARPTSAQLRQRLMTFVEKCRALCALVVLVSSTKSEVSESLDYLVDVALTLRVKDGEDHSSKPLRLITLSKSRHQMARHGTHVFHLSGESGFRFAPQLPSQIDAQHALAHMLWDRRTKIETLNVFRSEMGHAYHYREILTLPIRSHILIYGRGSTGKAGLALKCALSPRITSDMYDAELSSPRVLVVSFLYPEAYYEELRRRILVRIVRERDALTNFGFNKKSAETFAASAPKLGVLQFAPGFLSGEDLYSKLVRALEGAHLQGKPYTDVIIDGLHNLALQFPGARDTDVLWPIVYGTLARANVTTITTFTALEIQGQRNSAEAASPEDSLFRLRTHLPLMHALVQASDYVIEVSRAPAGIYYETRFHSAIDHEPPRDVLHWHRNNLEFVQPAPQRLVEGG